MKKATCIFISIIFLYAAIAQQKVTLKQQISLTHVDDIIANSKQSTFLVKGGNNYTLIDQSSKIQLGTVQVDVGSLGLPGFGQTYLWRNSSFLLSSGSEILQVNVVENNIDTLFKSIEFPEFIVQYAPAPWNDSLLIIATKIYKVDKNGNVGFFKADAKKNTIYDDTKNCRLLVYNIYTKKIHQQVKINFAITTFASGLFNTSILAGTFEGDIFKIDSSLNIQLITHAFNSPIHSVLTQQNFIISAPHIAPKYIGNEAAGTISLYNSEDKTSRVIQLPIDTPYVESQSGLNPAPSNQIKKIFSFPQQQSILVNYGYKRLLQINLAQKNKLEYKVISNAVTFYCFNKDSSLLLASTADMPGIFGVSGDIALYDLKQQKFQPSFNKPLTKEKFKEIYKLYDKNGNYHILGYKPNYGINDSLIIFSSNKTEPTYFVGKNCSFIIDETANTLLLVKSSTKLFGKLHLENLRLNSYDFFIGEKYYNRNDADSIDNEIFTTQIDTRKFINKDLPYQFSNVHALTSNKYLVVGSNPSATKTLYRIVLIDSLGKTIFKLNDFDAGYIVDVCIVSNSKKYFAFNYSLKNEQVFEVWDVELQKNVFIKTIPAKQSLSNYCFDKTRDVLWFSTDISGQTQQVFKVDLTSTVIQAKLIFSDPQYFSFQVDETNNLIVSQSYNQIRVARLSDRKELWADNPLTSSFKIKHKDFGFTFSTESEHYYVNSIFSNIYFSAFVGYKPVEILNNYLYKAEKTAIDNLAFVYNNHAYLPSDFDVYFNRPDSVLLFSGSTNSNFNQLVNTIVEKRKKKTNVVDLNTVLTNSPTCTILNKEAIKDFTKEQQIKITVNATAKNGATIKAIHVLDNGVPIFGKNGFIVKPTNNAIEQSIEIALIRNVNNMQLFVEDNNGLVSSSENLVVIADFNTIEKSTTHFIGIGINQFANPDYNLSWSVKDIRDLAIKLKSKYPNIIIDTLFDKNVTKENILALKQKLLLLNEDDKVIVSYSGHGVLSKEFDYFLSTYSIDFTKPEEKGLAYDDLESLLDNIKPRQKLMLIDACHSGEVDKDEIARIEASKKTFDSSGIVHKSTIKLVAKKNLGMANSFELMQSLFVNVGKGTGATIISAAGGMQYAQERGDLKNGVFTYSIIEAFNNNSTLTVSQLKKLVGERVTQLTNGLQKPTSRNETNNYDWEIW